MPDLQQEKSTGILQIILVQWFGSYDMATRAEYRGIGTFGNKNAAPDIETLELGVAITWLIKPNYQNPVYTQL